MVWCYGGRLRTLTSSSHSVAHAPSENYLSRARNTNLAFTQTENVKWAFTFLVMLLRAVSLTEPAFDSKECVPTILYMVVIPLFLAYGYTGWWFILYGRRVERKTEAGNAGWTSAFIQLCLSRYLDASFTWKIYQLMAKKLHIIMFSPLYQQTFEVELLPHSLYSSPANPAYIKQCRYCTYSAGGYKEAHFYILWGEYNYLNIYRWHIFVTL